MSLPKTKRAQWREEAGLGVCSDPRREFGRDYRIIELLDALEEAETAVAARIRELQAFTVDDGANEVDVVYAEDLFAILDRLGGRA